MNIRRYIYGFGGISSELAEISTAKNENVAAFVVDGQYLSQCTNNSLNIPVISFEEYMKRHEAEASTITISLGEPMYREKLSAKLYSLGLEEAGMNFAEYVSSSANIKCGTILHIGTVISTNCTIGRSCLINKNTIIGHDSTTGDFCVISPSVVMGGHVTIGSNCFVGLGARIRDRVTIGNNAVIGMGAVVTHDVEDDAVVFGCPAKFIRRNDTHKVFR